MGRRKTSCWKGIGVVCACFLAACSTAPPLLTPTRGEQALRQTSSRDALDTSVARVPTNEEDCLVWGIAAFNNQAAFSTELIRIWEEPLNDLLKKKGASYRVRLVDYSLNDGDLKQEHSPISNLLRMKERGEPLDLISLLPTPINRTGLPKSSEYVEACRQGLLYPLNEYLASEKSAFLKTGLTEQALRASQWKKINYGVFFNTRFFNALSVDIAWLERYEIPLEGLSSDINDYTKLLRRVKAETGAAPYLAFSELRDGLGFATLDGLDLTLMLNREGALQNPLLSDTFERACQTQCALKKEGLLRFSDRTQGGLNDIFALDLVTRRVAPYRTKLLLDSPSPNAHPQEKEVYVIPRLAAPIAQPGLNSAQTSLASWTKKAETALDFLARLYGDADFANLIRYGILGQHYRLEGGHAVYKEDCPLPLALFGRFYLNSLNAYPEADEESDRRWAATKAEALDPHAALAGFYFDTEAVKEEVKALKALFLEAQDLPPAVERLLSCGFTSEAEIKNLQKELDSLGEAAGSKRIIEAFERQLEEWKAGN